MPAIEAQSASSPTTDDLANASLATTVSDQIRQFGASSELKLVRHRDGDGWTGSGTVPEHKSGASTIGTGDPPVPAIELAGRRPTLWRLTERFEKHVLWRGTVLGVTKEDFVAELRDDDRGGAYEEARIPLQELSEDDLQLVAPGSTFFWAIGYNINAARRRERRSVIRFRRLPNWSREEVERALVDADELFPEIDRGSGS